MKEGTKVLWGKEFDLVKIGLAEEQVVAFVTELTSKYEALAEQRDHFVSMGTISERAAIEADKAASEIIKHAKNKAEAEAERIIAEANQKARDIFLEATKKAQHNTRKEVEDIIRVANQKSAIIETEAKQKTQLYLIKRRKEIQDQLREEIKKAYNQLLSGLQDLLGKGQEVETQWKNQTIELWSSKVFSLDWQDVMPASVRIESADNVTPVKIEAPSEESTPEAAATDTAVETEKAEPVALANDTQEESGDSEEAAQKEADALLKATQKGSDIEISAPDIESESVSNNGTDAVAEDPADATTDTIPLFEEIMKEAKKNKSKKDAPEVAISKEASKDVNDEEAKKPEEVEKYVADTTKLYEGEVDLVIVPPVGLPLLSAIHNELDKIPETKVLQTVGSWDKSTTIKVLLEKPMPLAQIITRIPGVEMEPEMTEKGNLKSRNSKFGGKQKGDQYIALKTSSSTS